MKRYTPPKKEFLMLPNSVFVMPLDPMVSMMLDCEITNTVIGTNIIITVEAALAPARLIPPAMI